MRHVWLAAAVAASTASRASGHAAMVSPLSRNAFDNVLPQYAGGKGSE
jgi:hypothetical protein